MNDGQSIPVKSKQMIKKSKARICMLDDTEEYIDLNVCSK